MAKYGRQKAKGKRKKEKVKRKKEKRRPETVLKFSIYKGKSPMRDDLKKPYSYIFTLVTQQRKCAKPSVQDVVRREKDITDGRALD